MSPENPQSASLDEAKKLAEGQSAASKKEPVIHVIPEQFYGAAGRAKIPKAKTVKAPQPAEQPKPAAPPTPGTPAAPKIDKPGGGKAWLLIPILAVVFLIALGFGAWYLLKPPALEAPQPAAPAVTLPPAEPEEQAPAPPPVEEPEEEPTEEPIEEPEEPVEEPEEGFIVQDADNDGLSDAEEALYGTDSESSDSDSDGYSDSVEVVNLYNPAGFKPTKLIEANLVKAYSSEEGGYEVLYPVAWSMSEQAGGEVVFTNPENEPVAVSIEANEEDQSVLDWYLSRNPEVSPIEVLPFYTKSGLEGVRGPDGLAAYIAAGDKVYIIGHAPGLKATVDFRSTFTMMVNSFSLNP